MPNTIATKTTNAPNTRIKVTNPSISNPSSRTQTGWASACSGAVSRARLRLRDNWRAPRFIVTVPGYGYKFVASFGAHGSPAAS
jgi:hypothetical protein